MRQRAMIVGIGLLCLVAGTAGLAGAEAPSSAGLHPQVGSAPTVVPTPAASPTATAPNAAALIAAMNRVMKTKGGVHETFHSKLDIPAKAREYVDGYLDTSWQFARARWLVTFHGVKLGKTAKPEKRMTVHTLVLGKHAATRQDHGKWACTTAGHVGGTSPPHFGTVQRPVLVGKTNVGGTSVWHLHSSTTSKAGATKTEDLYISVADGTLRKLTDTGTTRSGAGTSTTTDTATFSHYGEPVRTSLPSPCA